MRFPLAVISGVMGLVFVVNCTPQKASLPGYPPPGRLIDIGGRKLHLYCSGKGSPTVILVAGGGAFSIDGLSSPRIPAFVPTIGPGLGGPTRDLPTRL
jgi:hypothetical protein